MRTRYLNLLLAAVLALAVWRFWLAPGGPAPSPPPGTEEVAPGAAAGTPADGIAGSGTAAPEGAAAPAEGAPRTEGYDVIVARDLFSAARGVAPPAPAPAAKAAAKPPPQPKLTLSGVVILDGEKTAYLHEGAGEAKPRRVREGESFAGGTLKAIRPDGVTFVFGGNEISIPLRVPKDAGPVPAVGGRAAEPGPQPVPPRRPAAARPVPEQPGQVGLPRPVRQVPPAVVEEPPFDEEEPLPDEYYEEEGLEEGLDEGEMMEFDEELPEGEEEPLE